MKRRLKILGLKRRNSELTIEIGILNSMELTEEELEGQIRLILDSPNALVGYRFVWHRPRMQGTIVPRRAVEKILREIDPTGVQKRRTNRLRRRTYRLESCEKTILDGRSTFSKIELNVVV